MTPIVKRKEFDKYIEEVESGKQPLNYDHAFQLIHGVFCMTELTGARNYVIATLEDFIDITLKYFPAGSECDKMAKEIIRLSYMVNFKNEYIACYKRGTQFHDSKIVYLPRAEVEYDPEYIQLVGSGIPYIPYEDTETKEPFNVFMFIHEEMSDMKGSITFPGGHVQYNVDQMGETIDSICINGAKREVNEELGIDEDDLEFRGNTIINRNTDLSGSTLGRFKFLGELVDDMRSISYYHTGFCYAFAVPYEKAQHLALEDGKELVLFSPTHHEIKVADEYHKPVPIFHSIEEMENETGAACDSWVKEFISRVTKNTSNT